MWVVMSPNGQMNTGDDNKTHVGKLLPVAPTLTNAPNLVASNPELPTHLTILL